jgi:hypothetical protein
VVNVRETLIVNTQLKNISVLHDIKHMVSYLKGVLKGCPKFLDFKEESSITENFFFATEMATQ